MKRFKRVIAAALVCILTLCAATGCGGIISSEKTTEENKIKEYREDLYAGANVPLLDSSTNFSAAVAQSIYTDGIQAWPNDCLEGYQIYMSTGGKTTNYNAALYEMLLQKAPTFSGALYRILLFDGDLSVDDVCAGLKTEFNKEVDSGGKTYMDCVQDAGVSGVMIQVQYVENAAEDESVWAVFELVYGLVEEPALA